MRRLIMVTLLLGSLAGCAGRSSNGGNPRSATPEGVLGELIDVSASYRRLGRLAATGALPFIGTVGFVAGPGDSVIGIIGLSFENRALAFQREGSSFIARYRVGLSVQSGNDRPVELAREEVVRVATFPETQRTDESVLFQQSLRLTPGTYRVTVTVRDMSSTSESRADQSFTAPSFGAGTTTAPVFVYQATPRNAVSDPLSLVLNPRGTVAYGADTMIAYVEGYGFTSPTTVPFEVRDEKQRVVYQSSLRFAGGKPVEGQLVKVAPDSVPLGELKVAVGQSGAERSTTAIVSFSQSWVATNFNEVLDLLRFFNDQERLRTLRRAPEAERSRAWRTFYQDTDPDPATPENEALTAYFKRVAAANQLFRDEGMLGWQSDRGEVFITLGQPDETAETAPGRARVVRWNYFNYRLTLFFQDENGFGRLRLTQGSRSEFERTAARIRRRTP